MAFECIVPGKRYAARWRDVIDKEIESWRQLYQQQAQKVGNMTTLTQELTRVRAGDRRRYFAEGLATVAVVMFGIYCLSQGTTAFMTVVEGLLVLALIMLVHSVRNVGAIEGVNFASPQSYARDLESRNAGSCVVIARSGP